MCVVCGAEHRAGIPSFVPPRLFFKMTSRKNAAHKIVDEQLKISGKTVQNTLAVPSFFKEAAKVYSLFLTNKYFEKFFYLK
jgi:hypothetical protein